MLVIIAFFQEMSREFFCARQRFSRKWQGRIELVIFTTFASTVVSRAGLRRCRELTPCGVTTPCNWPRPWKSMDTPQACRCSLPTAKSTPLPRRKGDWLRIRTSTRKRDGKKAERPANAAGRLLLFGEELVPEVNCRHAAGGRPRTEARATEAGPEHHACGVATAEGRRAGARRQVRWRDDLHPPLTTPPERGGGANLRAFFREPGGGRACL